MQSFTKTEIFWIANELDSLAKICEKRLNERIYDQTIIESYQLRSEQYIDISRRLRAALEEGSKRIEIK